MRTPTLTSGAVAGLHRRGAGRWGVPAAVLIAVVMSVGVCAALTINRIDSGTEAAGSGWATVASAHPVPSVAASSAATGR